MMSRSRERSGGAWAQARAFDVEAHGSAEEALFAGLILLLRGHQEGVGQIPTREAMTAIVWTAAELLISGDLSSPEERGEEERTFFAVMLLILEQVAGRFAIRWLDPLMRSVRATMDRSVGGGPGSPLCRGLDQRVAALIQPEPAGGRRPVEGDRKKRCVRICPEIAATLRPIDLIIRDALVEALQRHSSVRSAAGSLGMAKSTLSDWVRRLGIQLE